MGIFDFFKKKEKNNNSNEKNDSGLTKFQKMNQK